MPHGLPDDADVVKSGVNYSLQDMAELAARLFSPVSYNRSGEVLFVEDFSCGFSNWEEYMLNGEEAFYICSGIGYQNGLAAELYCPGVYTDQAIIRKGFASLPLGIGGVATALAQEPARDHWHLIVRWYNGHYYWQAELYYTPTTNKLYYLDNAGVYVFIATVPTFSAIYNAYHFVKLLFDTAKGEYVRCMIDTVTYDLTGIQCQTHVSTVGEHIYVEINQENSVGSETSLYIGGVILTQNEV